MRHLRVLWLVGVCAVILFARVSNAQESAAVARVGVATPSAGAQESVPRLVQFSGTLKDAAARPVSGVASVTFAIYAEQEGGAALWSETQNVLADSSGRYSVLLGAATASGVPAELFGTGQSRWLGVTIARQPEMPRALMASVPYALKAGDADTLGGLPASSYVTAQQLAAADARGGNTTIVATPALATAAPATSAAPNASTEPVTQATPTGGGTTNYIPLWTSASNLGSSKIYQASGGDIGVNTTTPQVLLDVNGDSIFRGSFQLVPQGTATATTGQPSHSFQWEASTYGSTTKAAVTTAFGFRATPVGNNTTSPTSSLDLYYGPGGGTLTDTGLSISKEGFITFVPGQTFFGSSETLTGSLNLPNSAGSGSYAGAVTVGGDPFIADYGSTSNTFVGAYSGGAASATGLNNTAVGSYSLDYDTSGSGNSAFGYFALWKNSTGSSNTAVGFDALEVNTTGTTNTAVGTDALQNNTTGTYNVGIGEQTGYNNQSGSFNTFIGPSADAGVDGLTGATAIGSGAIVSASNAVVIGAAGSGASAVGIGTSTPTHTLDVVDRGAAGAAIYASSTIVTDTAVYGISTATSGSGSNGGFFSSASPNGSGVVGSNESGGYGGYFQGNNYAGYFAGNVGISGTLTKGAGSFKIDDPIDPANKYLSHSFVESPDMMNIYNGSVVLDAKGRATVTMPAWFDALNRDFQYQLTSIGGPGPRLYIAQEVRNNQFKIAGGKPGLKVSWQVTGVRHDAYADAHRIPTEEAKPANEQGKYLHPDLFGAGPDQAIGTAIAQSPAPAEPVPAPSSPSKAIPGGR